MHARSRTVRMRGREWRMKELQIVEVALKTNAVAGVASAGFARSCNLDNLPSPESIVSGNRIGELYAG